MRLANWNESELQNAIKTLEEAVANGVASASYPGGGTINYTSQSNMKTTLRSLYAALDKLQNKSVPRIRRVMHSSPSKGL